MKEQVDHKSIDKIFDSYFSMIGEAHIENLNNDLDSSDCEGPSGIHDNQSLDVWFRTFQVQDQLDEKRRKRLSRLNKMGKTAAILMVLLVSSLTVLTVTVEAFRVRLYDMIIEDKGSFTHISVGNEGQVQTRTYPLDKTNEITYVPEGYIEDEHVDMDEMSLTIFRKDDKILSISSASLGANYIVDTEDAQVQNVYINGNKGILSSKDETTILFWNQDNRTFTITSTVDQDEIIKIANGIKNK